MPFLSFAGPWDGWCSTFINQKMYGLCANPGASIAGVSQPPTAEKIFKKLRPSEKEKTWEAFHVDSGWIAPFNRPYFWVNQTFNESLPQEATKSRSEELEASGHCRSAWCWLRWCRCFVVVIMVVDGDGDVDDDDDDDDDDDESGGDGDFVDHTFIFLTVSPHLSHQNLGFEEGPGGVAGEDGRSTGMGCDPDLGGFRWEFNKNWGYTPSNTVNSGKKRLALSNKNWMMFQETFCYESNVWGL